MNMKIWRHMRLSDTSKCTKNHSITYFLITLLPISSPESICLNDLDANFGLLFFTKSFLSVISYSCINSGKGNSSVRSMMFLNYTPLFLSSTYSNISKRFSCTLFMFGSLWPSKNLNFIFGMWKYLVLLMQLRFCFI